MRALLVALLLASGAGAQSVPWNGTLVGRPVTCATVPTIGLGNQYAVTVLGLWCRGTRHHALRFIVWSDDPRGLRIEGQVCRRGPRPGLFAHPTRWKPRRLGLSGNCCAVAGGSFEGQFTPVDPTDYPLLYTGDLTAVQLGMTCGRRIFPTLPPTIDLRVMP
jgi:hypothetical protein